MAAFSQHRLGAAGNKTAAEANSLLCCQIMLCMTGTGARWKAVAAGGDVSHPTAGVHPAGVSLRTWPQLPMIVLSVGQKTVTIAAA